MILTLEVKRFICDCSVFSYGSTLGLHDHFQVYHGLTEWADIAGWIKTRVRMEIISLAE